MTSTIERRKIRDLQIPRDNIKFLQKLPEGSAVNIDSEGRLYQEHWFIAFVKRILGIVSVDAQKIALDYAKKQIIGITDYHHKLDVINQLGQSNLLSSNDKTELTILWLSQKEGLLEQGLGISDSLAKTLTILEALHSPDIDEGYKREGIAPRLLILLKNLNTEEMEVVYSEQYTSGIAQYIHIEDEHAGYLDTMDRLRAIGMSEEDRMAIGQNYYASRPKKLEGSAHREGQLLYEKRKDPLFKHEKLDRDQWKELHAYARAEITHLNPEEFRAFIQPFSKATRAFLTAEYTRLPERRPPSAPRPLSEDAIQWFSP